MGCVCWIRPLCKEFVDVTAGRESTTEPGNTRAALGAAN